ncbi:MAG: MFS transporter [Acidobacteriota bacterium]
MVPAAGRFVDVGQLLDDGAWSRYQKRLVVLTALAIIFDGFDNQLLGLALPAMMRDWGVARGAFAPVVSLGYLGMMIGGAAAGLAGDQLGRRTALVFSVLIFGGATVGMAFAGDVTTLMIVRTLAGVGLGGAIPNGASLAAEYVPLRQRPLAVTLTIVCVPVGGVLAGLFAVPALPAVGWRGMFAIGGVVPLITAIVLWRVLPESPRYLARHPARWPELRRLVERMGFPVDAESTFDRPKVSQTGAGGTVIEAHHVSPFRSLFSREFRADTIALWAAFLSCLLAVYLAFAWLPSLLVSAGLGATVASTGLTMFNLGGVVGAIAGGAVIARLGSRRTMLTMASGAVIGALVLSAMRIDATAPAVPILVLLAITGGLINAVQTTMYALAAHVYPTAIRATGVGTASAVGRSGAILSGYAGPWALDLRGSTSFFAVMALSLTMTVAALALVRRHVSGARGGSV